MGKHKSAKTVNRQQPRMLKNDAIISSDFALLVAVFCNRTDVEKLSKGPLFERARQASEPPARHFDPRFLCTLKENLTH